MTKTDDKRKRQQRVTETDWTAVVRCAVSNVASASNDRVVWERVRGDF